MRKELEDTLYNDFPLLYKNPEMEMGFECGDGWYDLIKELSVSLYPLVEKCRKIPNPYDSYPCAVQVKEKFGCLRFYMNVCSEEIYALIDEAETGSQFICESCGNPGSIDYKQQWYKCRCEQHRDQ